MVKLLLLYRPNIECVDYYGNTPFENNYSKKNINNYKKILELLKNYKKNNINIIDGNKIGIIAAHGVIDKNRFCIIPDNINIYSQINKGNILHNTNYGRKNGVETIDQNGENYLIKNQRKFYIKNPGKIFKSGTIIHDIELSFILGWGKRNESISNINDINNIDTYSFSGIISDTLPNKFIDVNNNINKESVITNMLSFHDKFLIPDLDLIYKDYYLSDILKIIKESGNCHNYTFILFACRGAKFNNNNNSRPSGQLVRTSSAKSSYKQEFGSELIQSISINDLITNNNIVEEIKNINNLDWGLNLSNNEINKLRLIVKFIINNLHNNYYINRDDFDLLLNIKNKNKIEINRYIQKNLYKELYNTNISKNYVENSKNSINNLAKLENNIGKMNYLKKENKESIKKNIQEKIAKLINN
jgi:hypothetical protein